MGAESRASRSFSGEDPDLLPSSCSWSSSSSSSSVSEFEHESDPEQRQAQVTQSCSTPTSIDECAVVGRQELNDESLLVVLAKDPFVSTTDFSDAGARGENAFKCDSSSYSRHSRGSLVLCRAHRLVEGGDENMDEPFDRSSEVQVDPEPDHDRGASSTEAQQVEQVSELIPSWPPGATPVPASSSSDGRNSCSRRASSINDLRSLDSIDHRTAAPGYQQAPDQPQQEAQDRVLVNEQQDTSVDDGEDLYESVTRLERDRQDDEPLPDDFNKPSPAFALTDFLDLAPGVSDLVSNENKWVNYSNARTVILEPEGNPILLARSKDPERWLSAVALAKGRKECGMPRDTGDPICLIETGDDRYSRDGISWGKVVETSRHPRITAKGRAEIEADAFYRGPPILPVPPAGRFSCGKPPPKPDLSMPQGLRRTPINAKRGRGIWKPPPFPRRQDSPSPEQWPGQCGAQSSSGDPRDHRRGGRRRAVGVALASPSAPGAGDDVDLRLDESCKNANTFHTGERDNIPCALFPRCFYDATKRGRSEQSPDSHENQTRQSSLLAATTLLREAWRSPPLVAVDDVEDKDIESERDEEVRGRDDVRAKWREEALARFFLAQNVVGGGWVSCSSFPHGLGSPACRGREQCRSRSRSPDQKETEAEKDARLWQILRDNFREIEQSAEFKAYQVAFKRKEEIAKAAANSKCAAPAMKMKAAAWKEEFQKKVRMKTISEHHDNSNGADPHTATSGQHGGTVERRSLSIGADQCDLQSVLLAPHDLTPEGVDSDLWAQILLQEQEGGAALALTRTTSTTATDKVPDSESDTWRSLSLPVAVNTAGVSRASDETNQRPQEHGGALCGMECHSPPVETQGTGNHSASAYSFSYSSQEQHCNSYHVGGQHQFQRFPIPFAHDNHFDHSYAVPPPANGACCAAQPQPLQYENYWAPTTQQEEHQIQSQMCMWPLAEVAPSSSSVGSRPSMLEQAQTRMTRLQMQLDHQQA